ncbi:MAG: hypothetical protein MI807_20840, partial [Verrucomicrobiales bacterium]|nr:hypothetical protein [Verrucomicrobiales bacterium]
PNLEAGTVTLSGANINVGSLLDSTTSWNNVATHTSGLNLIASGDIDVNWSIQAPGTGDVNLVAGANIDAGSIVDGTDLTAPINHLYCPPTAVMNILAVKPDGSQFGNANTDINGDPIALTSGGLFSSDAGEIQIGNTSRGIAVGSQHGMTNVLGYGVYVTAGNGTDEYAQVGFRSLDQVTANNDPTAAFGDASGDIMVHAKEGGIDLTAGTNGGSTYAQIGHGGYDPTDTIEGEDPSHSGMISVDATFGAADGNIAVRAGTDPTEGTSGFSVDRQFAMIGHGGFNLDGDHGGVNSVTGASVPGLADAANGGGATITISAAGVVEGSLLLTIGAGTITDAGGVLTHSTEGVVGSIDYATGVATFTADGNPGDDLVASVDYDKESGIVVKGADVLVQGGGNNVGTDDSFAQIGHGGRASAGNHSGDITVEASGALGVLAGQGDRAYAQIGNGGDDSDGVKDGDINITASGDITLTATQGLNDGGVTTNLATGPNGWVAIGHGGRGSAGNTSGSVIVNSGGAITGTAGDTNGSSVQIGHGGLGARGDHGVDGDILSVIADGNITMLAGDGQADDGTIAGVDGRRAYAQIGFGGLDADNPNPGYYSDNAGGTAGAPTALERVGNTADITVTSANGNISFASGSQRESYAQLGHGGAYTDGDHTGDVTVSAVNGSISFDAAAEAGVDPTTTTSSNNPAYRYVHLGHGGERASGGHDGDITVTAGNGVAFAAGTTSLDYAQLGHGGRNDLRVSRNSAQTAQNNGNDRYYAGTHTGDIMVTSTSVGSDITFSGGMGTAGTQAYAQLGHGGARNAAEAGEGHEGSITVASQGRIDFTAGARNQNYVHLGHGGYEAFGNHGRFDADGDGTVQNEIVVSARNGIAFTAGQGTALGSNGDQAYAMLGHGGHDADFQTNRSLIAEGPIPPAPTTTTNYHLNTPEADALGTAGNITVLSGVEIVGGIPNVLNSDAKIEFTGGNDSGAFAQLGNGGRNTSGAHAGEITAAAANEIVFSSDNAGKTTSTTSNGGPATGAYVQLGNGGQNADARTNAGVAGHGADAALGISGDITVGAGLGGAGGVRFLAGDQNDNYAQLGHGGRGGRGDHSGDISVDSVGTIDFLGNDDMRAYVQLGHGGHDADDTGTALGNTGDIFINTNPLLVQTAGAGINFIAGNGEESYAQLGHGGYGTAGDNSSAAFEVRTDGNLVIRSGNGTGAGNDGGDALNKGVRSFAKIGHGGYGGDGTNSGDICVHVGGSITMDSAAGGNSNTNGFTQIGHGGRGIDGDHNGKITVVAGRQTQGDITMVAGDATRQFVQIGHGGDDSSGNLAGRVFVVADNSGNLTMTGGGANGSYVMSGHGDGRGTYGNFASGNTSGTRQGGLQYFVDGNATLNTGTAGNTNVHLLHRTTDGASPGLDFPGSYLGGDGYQYVVNGAQVGNATGGNTLARENENTILAGNLGAGNVVLTNYGNATYNLPAWNQYVNHSFDFVVMATGNLTVNSSFQNAGDGRVALVAGWDGVQDVSSVNFNAGDCNPEIIPGSIDFNNCDRFGYVAGDTAPAGAPAGTAASYTQGILTIGDANQSEAVRIGSRHGTTYLRGNGIVINASDNDANRFTQIGFHHNAQSSVGTIAGAATGAIDVKTHESGLTMNGGNANGAFVQIGHGGTGSINSAVDAQIDISFCESGDIAMFAGDGNASYAQIGHGLRDQNNTRAGDINITNFENLSLTGGANTDSYSMIGHGGYNSDGTKTGAINLTGTTVLADQGNISLLSGTGQRSWTQIGHAGRSSNGNVTADITISNFLDLSAKGHETAAGYDAYTQVGHGGVGAGGDHSGTIDIDAGGSVQFASGKAPTSAWGTNLYQYSQLGHGGVAARGDHSGTIDVDAVGNIEFSAGQTLRAYSQLGHGGAESERVDNDAAADQGHGGSIFVTTTTGDIIFTGDSGGGSGTIRENYAQLGHGGSYTYGNHYGAIDVDAASDSIQFNGGTGSGDMAYAMIGHGGRETRGNGHSGQIDVDAQSIAFLGGSAAHSHVRIGHGGFEADANVGHTGAINVTATGAAGIEFRAGNRSETFAQLGHGGMRADGEHDGAIKVDSQGGGILFASGSPDPGQFWVSYAQLGHGGYEARGNRNGTIDVDAAGDIEFDASLGGRREYVQLGHGGWDSDDPNGAEDASDNGNIFVNTTNGGNLVFRASERTVGGPTPEDSADGNSAQESYAHLGHGGYNASGNQVGDITVGIDGTIDFLGGTGGTQTYALLGHGGTSAKGANSGTISVTANGIDAVDGFGIRFQSGGGNQAYTHLGHGGWDADSSTGGHNGDISVTATAANADIIFSALSHNAADLDNDNAYSMLGHGGRASNGDHFGTIDVTTAAGGDINFTGGDALAFAQLGHGGRDSIGNMGDDGTGDLTVSKITVNSGGAIGFAGGTTGTGWGQQEAYAQLGHGGYQASGNHIGEIDVDAVGNIEFTAGSAYRSYTQLGHGGQRARGDHSGDIEVDSATGGITFSGGGINETYAQLGHGGYDADNPNGGGQWPNVPVVATVGNTGDITVNAAGNIHFLAGDENAFAQLGHGGIFTNGDNTGDISVISSGGALLLDSRHDNTNSNHYTQVGHGGMYASGNMSGSITVDVDGDIELLAGRNSSYSQIGHGGRNEHNTGVQEEDPDNATPANRRFYDRRVANNDGYLPGTHTGAISVTGGGKLDMIGVDGLGNTGNHGGGTYVQIGHGGFRNSADPNSANGSGHNGTIDVNITGNARILSGYGVGETYGQIGHGGYQAMGNHGHNLASDPDASNIDVSVGGTLEMRAQGGYDGGWGNRGYNNYTQIGHGGYDTDFRDAANIGDGYATLQWFGPEVDPNGNNPTPGSPPAGDPYSATDDPGWNPNAPTSGANPAGAGNFGGATRLGTLGDVKVTTGGNVVVTASDDVNVNNVLGESNWSQIGNGGRSTDGNHVGDVTLDSGGSISFRATQLQQDFALSGGGTVGNNNGYVQLGNGGLNARGDHDGGIDVDAIGAITFTAGTTTQSYAHLGHGGFDADEPNSGDPVVVDGHDGNSGDINVDAGGDISFAAGNAYRSYSQLGHGGAYTGAKADGDIRVVSRGGAIAFSGGIGANDGDTQAYGQLGHGGYDGDGTMSGDIYVEADGDVSFLSGDREDNYTQLGHGGRSSRSGTPGNPVGNSGHITVIGDDISFVAGTLTETNPTNNNGRLYSMLGHGGYDADVFGDNTYVAGLGHNGDINVTASGNLRVIGGDSTNGSAGGGNGREHFAQIGHGGTLSGGDHAGSININATGTVDVLAGTTVDNDGGHHNHAMIGHGGSAGTNWNVTGGDLNSNSLNGNTDGINVSGSAVTVQGGDNDSYAMIGNGGR